MPLRMPFGRQHRAIDPRGVRRRGRFGHEHIFAACLAHFRELILLLRKDRVANFMARQREIRRAYGANRARYYR